MPPWRDCQQLSINHHRMLSAAPHRQREASTVDEKAPTYSYNPLKSSKFDFDAEHKTMCTSSLRASSISVCNCASAAASQTSLHSAIPTVLCLHAALWKWYHPNFYGMSLLYMPHYLLIFCLHKYTFF